jgi:hypothetical protein
MWWRDYGRDRQECLSYLKPKALSVPHHAARTALTALTVPP